MIRIGYGIRIGTKLGVGYIRVRAAMVRERPGLKRNQKGLRREWLFQGGFASSKIPFFFKKFPNFDNQTFPKLTKTKSLENPV